MAGVIAKYFGGPGVMAEGGRYRDALGRYAARAPAYFGLAREIWKNKDLINFAAGSAYVTQAGANLRDFLGGEIPPRKPMARRHRVPLDRHRRGRRRYTRAPAYKRKRYGKYKRRYKRRFKKRRLRRR